MDRMVQGLSNEQVTAYRRDGFLHPLSVFTASETSAWADEVLDLAATGIPVPWQRKAHLLLPSLDWILRDRRLTDRVASILGEDLLAVEADLVIAPVGGLNGNAAWQRDVTIPRLDSLDLLTAVVALTPITPARGGLRYARGGHVEGGAPLPTDGVEAVEAVLAPGEVVLHHVLTPHASRANPGTEPQVAFAVRYAPTSVTVREGAVISARLARGVDRYRNVRLEAGTGRALSADALAAHRAALTPSERHGAPARTLPVS